ncbi:hypothetical protein Ssi03_28820 [Sphaerisporangium siamense]|uniref:Anti-sigma regulatory factor (Ser/Thr protein kinase) n=1 Tax=Sphaerisporangium siamense TaxID=795645 RepID=A0A7W7GDC9_9ACTN|nr:ATP-binding protein [Sphaerisporangium siamense]MBB4704424.1 anti-sigma regulatory factor (Ser/Thr protein kinase) [Sphaerisporangium siamense]GII84892.1 hypothetical protein Ssi03_28820 [Sphaerisporangium siamense]
MRAEQPVTKALHRTGVTAQERPARDGLRIPRSSTRLTVLVTALSPGSASRVARLVVRGALAWAGVNEDAIGDAEITVAELAANSERHAGGPYELRVHHLDGVPVWCEMVDGGELGEVPAILRRLATAPVTGPMFAESGRGLLLAHRLSHGRCYAYPTTLSSGGGPAKAVAFRLPAPASVRDHTVRDHTARDGAVHDRSAQEDTAKPNRPPAAPVRARASEVRRPV